MTIACLGWGSLIWEPGKLPVKREDWQPDGPTLPVEFSRHSNGNRVTLVIRKSGPAIPVLWCPLPVKSVVEAAELLRVAEGNTKSKWIGRWPSTTGVPYLHQESIAKWASSKKLDGVVWTAIPPKWNGRDGEIPELEDVVAFLSALGPISGAKALEYIHEAPGQIQTPLRPALEWARKSIVGGPSHDDDA